MQNQKQMNPWPPWWQQLLGFISVLSKKNEKENGKNGKENN